MKIKIINAENDKKQFSINDEDLLDFTYESLKRIINEALSCDDEPDFETASGLEDYETLIKELIKKSRTDDFKNAVRNAKDCASKVNEEL